MAMDIEKICRTCLGLSGPLLSIYDGGGGGGGCIADMLRDFTKTKPRQEDKLPDRVCLSCISEINRCYSFKLKCENSCRTLRQLVPDALPEESNEPQKVKAMQYNKAVQTQPEFCKKLATVCTQTKVILEPERSHQHVQTSPQRNPTMKNRSTSPMIFELLRLDKIKVDKSLEKTRAEEIQIIETKKFHDRYNLRHQSSLVVADAAENKPHSFQDFEQSDDETNAIIMEFDAEDTEINENVPELARYSPLRAEQEEESNENAIIHYKLTTEQQSENGSENLSTNMEHNLSDATQQILREDDVEYVEDEDHYARFTYNDDSEEYNGSANTQGGNNYNFTIVAKRKAPSNKQYTKSEVKKSRKELKCDFCPMTFVSAKRLARHTSKRHGSEVLRGSKEFIGEEEKNAQVESNNSENNLEVNAYTEDNKTELNLNNSEMVPKNDILSNTAQPIVQTTKPAKLLHFCESCGAGFALHRSLIHHMKQDLCKKVNFKCNKCDRVFISLETLNEHNATHLLDHECTECGICLKTSDELGQHMIKVHKRNLRNQCPICKKVFTILSALKDHLRVHSGEKPFLCTICQKGFTQKANLNQHLMRHSKEKNFKCPECAMTFVTKGELCSHQRTHTGEHPFRCDECQATFTISSSLVKHKRIHTGERPYACDLCPKRFTSSFTLKNHRRVHTGERPYKCRYCSKSFTQKQDCIAHHRTHTGERNYACFCGEKFAHSGTLRTHMKIHDGADGGTAAGGKRRSSTRMENATAKNLRRRDSEAYSYTILDVHEDNQEGEQVEGRGGETYDQKATTVVTVECEEAVSEEKLMQLAIEEA